MRSSQNDLQTFVYSVAHDFRRPISQIRTIAELLQENLGERVQGETAELLGWMMTASDNALLMMERLLIFSRLATQKSVQNNVDVAQLCEAVVQHELLPALSTPAPVIDLQVERGTFIYADADIIRCLVRELVSNALVYGAGTSVQIRAARVDECFLLAVRDGGEGIDPRQLEGALRPFGRLVAEDAQHVGLGLNCVQRIAEMIDGELEFKQLHPGFEVTMRCPHRSVQAAAS